MTIEIKQVDREVLANAFDAVGLSLTGDDIRQNWSRDAGTRASLNALATQRSTYEARIAELERERDAHHDRAIKARGQRNKAWTDLKAAEARLAEAVEVIRPFALAIKDHVGDPQLMTQFAWSAGEIRRAARFIQETERG